MENVHIILGAPKEEKIKPLITEKGLVIGVDRGALIALEEGIPLDIALGDFDSISTEEFQKIKKQAGNVFSFPSDKDDTDTELAFKYVLENHPSANIFLYNWYGGRIDHLYSILLLTLQARFSKLTENLHYVSGKNYVSYFLPGEHRVQRIKDMDYLSYILLTKVESLTLENVKYTLEEESFNQPMALISNEFLNGEASFSFKKGIIAVVQSKD